MNPELEQLVAYAITDGYISDKERKVLFKKAEKMGFDVDELEMILEGKLAEKGKSARADLKKCPSCGEVIKGLNRVCPSCDYLLNTGSFDDGETLHDKMKKVDDSLYSLRSMPKVSNSQIHNAVFKIYLTAGLYVIYKKFLKKESLFNSYGDYQDKIVRNIERQLNNLEDTYGDDRDVSLCITEKRAEYKTILQQRSSGDTRSAIGACAVMAAVVVGGYFMVKAIQKSNEEDRIAAEKDPKKRVEKFIEEKKIGEGFALVGEVENEESREYLTAKLWSLKIDSLAAAGDVYEAISAANLHIADDGYHGQREAKIDAIVERKVLELIDTKDFKTAKEHAAMASLSTKMALEDKIELAETLSKTKK